MTLMDEMHALGALAREGDPFGLCAGQHRQIAPVGDRMQKGFCGGPAHAAPLVDLEVAAALVVASVEVVDGGDVGLLRRLAEGIQYRPRQALALDPPLARTGMEFAFSSVVILELLEDGQDVVPAPAPVSFSRPTVVIGGLATHVDHAIDG